MPHVIERGTWGENEALQFFVGSSVEPGLVALANTRSIGRGVGGDPECGLGRQTVRFRPNC